MRLCVAGPGPSEECVCVWGGVFSAEISVPGEFPSFLRCCDTPRVQLAAPTGRMAFLSLATQGSGETLIRSDVHTHTSASTVVCVFGFSVCAMTFKVSIFC